MTAVSAVAFVAGVLVARVTLTTMLMFVGITAVAGGSSTMWGGGGSRCFLECLGIAVRAWPISLYHTIVHSILSACIILKIIDPDNSILFLIVFCLVCGY